MALFNRTPAIHALDLRPVVDTHALTERISLLEAKLDAATAGAMIARKPSGKRKTQVHSSTASMLDTSNAFNRQSRQLMESLYSAYVQNPWISAPIDTIARRITSGGIDIVQTSRSANPADREKLLNLFLYVNDEDNAVALMQRNIVSQLIFGRFYNEVVWAGGYPYELYYVDPVTMEPHTDEKGTIETFVQQMGADHEITLTPSQIVYGVTTGPRNERLSPIEKLFCSHVVYTHMMRWSQKWFEHGAKPLFSIKLSDKSGRDDAENFLDYWDENYTGVENAHRDPVTFGGAELNPLGSNNVVEMDFLQSIKYVREEFLAVLGVPPMAVNVSDNGSRLTDMGPSVDKAFRNNTTEPAKQRIEEVFTYRVIQQGFGIQGWRLSLMEASYDSDELLVNLVTAQIKSGLLTLDEGRQHLGTPGKIPGGKEAVIITNRDVTPVRDLTQIHSAQFVNAQQQAMTQGLDPHAKPTDLAKASPRDAMAQDDTHPVAMRDAQMQQQQDTVSGVESVADLVRWQRVAARVAREGGTQRAFLSESIPGEIHDGLINRLAGQPSEAQVREAFDWAFAQSKRPTPAADTKSLTQSLTDEFDQLFAQHYGR